MTPPKTAPAETPLVSQRFVDRIVARAQNSAMGLGNPDKPNAYELSRYECDPQNFGSVAILLVSAHFEKYDLVSLFCAAMEEIDEHFAALETANAELRGALEEILNHFGGQPPNECYANRFQLENGVKTFDRARAALRGKEQA